MEASNVMGVAVGTRSAETAPDEAFTPFWLVSSLVERDEANALSHKVMGRAMPRESMAAGPDLPFGARCVLTTRPDLGLMSCFNPLQQWSWPASSGTAGLRHALMRPADGRVVVEQGERRFSVRAREAAVLSFSQDTRFSLVQTSRIDLIALDPARLPVLREANGPGLMQAIPRGNGGLQVLAHYGALLLRGLLPLNSVPLQSLAIGHVHDLVGAMLADRSAPAPSADGRRTGRIAALKADIEARLERRDLGVEMVASLHGVSARAIQKLFESEGRTFSDYVLERRLDRAWHRLVTSEGAGMAISAVAFEVGFGDLSYFNRCFRKRFGRSPSQVKAGAESLDAQAP